MSLDRYRIDLALLVVSQALYLSASIGMFTFGGLVGAMLTPVPALATLPISAFAVGTALMAIPMSLLMKRWGRRRGFLVAICAGIFCGIAASTAILIGSFWLFCFATLALGCYQAGAQFYRFAAMEVVPLHYRSRAVSYVIAGGILAALFAPVYFNTANSLTEPITFLGAYMGIIVLGLVAFIPISLVRFPAPEDEVAGEGETAERPLRQILRQPVFLAAVANGCGGFALMHLVMTAAPVAIVACGFAPVTASYVIQWHILAMTVPAFVTGTLIHRFGIIPIAVAGMALYIISAGIALDGLTVTHFGAALILVGIGWNFMFTAGTTLLAESHTPAERAKVQGVNDFFVFGGSAIASLSAGSLHSWFGWDSIQYTLFVFVGIVAALTVWYAAHRKNIADIPG
ncbi:MAG: MFS transporter [Alphaproteobacteria bacterium]|nr:MAG: MFS transporter [Alphaproteobacteria bacterium]